MKQCILFFLLLINMSVYGQAPTPPDISKPDSLAVVLKNLQYNPVNIKTGTIVKQTTSEKLKFPDNYFHINIREQLLPDKNYTFETMHRNPQKLTIEAYLLPDSVSMTVFNTLIKGYPGMHSIHPASIPVSLLQKRAKVWSYILSPSANEDFDIAQISMSIRKPGYYILVARKADGSLMSGTYFIVSNVLTAYKFIAGSWYVYALDGASGRPLENFEWMTFKTDEDGCLLQDTTRSGKIVEQNGFTPLFPMLSTQSGKSYGMVRSSEKQYSIPLLLKNEVREWKSKALQFPGILTDRQVYAPGDTIFYKVFFPEELDKQSAEENKMLKILLRGDGITRADTLKMNAWGSASGTMVLPLYAKSGVYYFYANGKGISSIYVQGSKNPLLEIDLDPMPVVMLGDSIRVKGRVSYLNGIPFVHKMVHFTLSSFSGTVMFRNQGEPKVCDSVECDADGRFMITVPSAARKFIFDVYESCNLKLSVQDGSFYRREINETLFVRTVPYRLAWEVPSMNLNGPSLPPIRAYDHEDKEIELRGEYTLRQDTNIVKIGKFVSGTPFTSNWKNLPSGNYSLEYTAQNSFGPKTRFTLLSPESAPSEAMGSFFYIPRDTILEGEDISFVAASKTSMLLVRVNVYDDTMGLVQTSQFTCDKGAHPYKLILDKSLKNRARFEFVANEGGDFITQKKEVPIACPLRVRIEKIQSRIMGRAKQHLRIQVKGALDKGVESELMLAVYQKSKKQRDNINMHPISYTRSYAFTQSQIITNMREDLFPLLTVRATSVRIKLDDDQYKGFYVTTRKIKYDPKEDYYPENMPRKLVFEPHLMTDTGGVAEFSFDVPNVNGTYVVEVCAKNRKMQTAVTKEEFEIFSSSPDSLVREGYADSIRAYVSSKSSLVGTSLVDLKSQELFRDGVSDERMALYMLSPNHLLLNELGSFLNTTSESFPDQLNRWFVNGMGSVVWSNALKTGIKKMSPEFVRPTVNARNRKYINQIQFTQNEDGGYPWYKGMPSSVLCTELFFTRYLGLVECGYFRGKQFTSTIYIKSLSYLDKWIVSEYQEHTKYPGTKEEVSPEVLNYLLIRSAIADSRIDVATKKAYSAFMNEIRNNWKNYSLEAMVQVAAVLSKSGEDVSPMLKVLEKQVVRDQIGTCKLPLSGDVSEQLMYKKNLLNNPVRTHATLLSLLNREAGDENIAGGIAQWLMLQRKEKIWKECITQTDAVWALWMYYSKNEQKSYTTEIKFSGASGITKSRSESFPGVSVDIKRVKKNDQKFLVRNLEGSFVFADLVYRYKKAIREQQIKCSDGYTLKVTYWKESPDAKRVSLSAKSFLQKGDVIVVNYEITTDRTRKLAELSVDRLQNLALVNPYSEYSGSGYYRDIRDKTIVFFFETLSKGSTRIEERYVVRKDGNMPPMQIQIKDKGIY